MHDSSEYNKLPNDYMNKKCRKHEVYQTIKDPPSLGWQKGTRDSYNLLK